MKIFVLSSNVPFRDDTVPGVTAINVQVSLFIETLLRHDHRITLQIVTNRFHGSSLSGEEERECAFLTAQGVTVLPVLFSPDGGDGPRRRLRRIARRVRAFLRPKADIADWYPESVHRAALYERITRAGPERILAVCSPEGLAASYGYAPVPTTAFQGDLDHVPAALRVSEGTYLAKSTGALIGHYLSYPLKKLLLAKYRAAHILLMRDVEDIANATASNVPFYRETTPARVRFIGTTWKEPPMDLVERILDRASHRQNGGTVRIIGHLGHLGSTGSIFGLRFLFTEMLPALERAFAGIDYEVHVIGKGALHPRLSSYATHPRIRMRGFVKDLEPEYLTNDIFLFLNNAGPHQAAYTRHIIAWSLGLCLITHANSTRAIPEIVPGTNALTGATAPEIAAAVRAAATDGTVNMTLRRGGIATYRNRFTPAHLAGLLIGETPTARGNPV